MKVVCVSPCAPGASLGRPGSSAETLESQTALIQYAVSLVKPATSATVPGALRATLRLLGGDLGRASLFPCLAFKAVRAGGASASGNLLFGGRKVGQAASDFFASPLSTVMTEKVPSIVKSIFDAFRQYSAHPTHIGLSDFAAVRADGEVEPQLAFPWALLLRPTAAAREASAGALVEGGGGAGEPPFLRQLEALPPGTPLYELFAVPSPAAALGEAEAGAAGGPEPLERIGTLVATSAFVRSSTDARLAFWHQPKEQDYEKRPEWLRQLRPEHRWTCGAEHFCRLVDRAGAAEAAARVASNT